MSIQSSSQNNELIHISYALRGAEVNIGQCSTPFQKATQYSHSSDPTALSSGFPPLIFFYFFFTKIPTFTFVFPLHLI